MISVRMRMTQAARKRRIGAAHVRHVLESTDAETVTLSSGNQGLRWIGTDDRGDVLEVLGLELTDQRGEPYLLITHVMPHRYRRKGGDDDA